MAIPERTFSGASGKGLKILEAIAGIRNGYPLLIRINDHNVFPVKRSFSKILQPVGIGKDRINP